jgi:hypothetical protein
VQSLPTEAKPLSACSQCGTALPAPTGSATFVYGVGPVGYQSCNTCGAKWRYLWQDPPGAGGGLNRLPFLLVGTAVVVLIAFGAFALLRSPTAYSPTSASAGTTTPTTNRTSSTTTTPAAPTSNGADFTRILDPVDKARPEFVDFLENSAISSQQFEVNQRVAAFVGLAQPSIDALKRAHWPAEISADMDQLVKANQQFITDVDLVQYGLLYSTSFAQKITTDVQNIQKYEALVKKALDLPAS